MGKASNVDAKLSCMRKAYLSCVSRAQADAYVHGLIFHGVLGVMYTTGDLDQFGLNATR